MALGTMGGWIWTLSAQSYAVADTLQRQNALAARDNMTQDSLTDIKVRLGKIETEVGFLVEQVKKEPK